MPRGPLKPCSGSAREGYPPRARRWPVAAASLILGLAACDHQPRPSAPEQESMRVAGAPPRPNLLTLFGEAVASYDEAARRGWPAGACEDVARRFEESSSALAPGVPEALFDAGVTWEGCGRVEEAWRAFEAADAVARRAGGRGFAPALVRLGAITYRRGDRELARRLFERARDADRRSVEAYVNLALLHGEVGRFEEAQLDIRRALAIDSDSLVSFALLARVSLTAARQNPERLHMVPLICQQAETRARQLSLGEAELAPIHNLWGLALTRQGDVVGAVEHFDRARQLDRDFFEAQMNFGAVNLSFRGFAAAEQAFRQALALRPEAYEAHLSLGAALRGLLRFDEARAEYEAALRLDSSRPEAHYNLAILRQDYLLGQAEGVEAQLELLERAREGFRRFLGACGARPESCRRSPQGAPGELRAAALRRIESCATSIASRRESN